MTALCLKANHSAPIWDCTCGIYAVRDITTLPVAVSDALVVIGEVSLWGKVIEHGNGYRAQYAYPKRFVLQGDTIIARELEIAYGAPVTIAPSTIHAYGTQV